MSQSIILVKYLTQSGYCSRRQAAELIKSGKVKVNGHVMVEPWYEVKNTDKVQVGKTTIFQPPKDYILLNKPAGYVTTLSDEQGKKTVTMLIQGASKLRVYPVGRLDKDTKGLLLFTNDGELAHRLAHPKYEIEKVYVASLHEPLKLEHLEALQKGVRLEDGFVKPDAISYIPGRSHNNIRVKIHSGKKRIVRRLFEHFDYHVTKLDRIRYAGLTQKGLSVGSWRKLNQKEIEKLHELAGLGKKPTVKKGR